MTRHDADYAATLVALLVLGGLYIRTAPMWVTYLLLFAVVAAHLNDVRDRRSGR